MTAGGNTYVKWSKQWTVKNGVFTVALIPNDTAEPAGTSYSVRYVPNSGPSWSEIWVVTTGGPLEIWQVRVLSTPVPEVLISLSQLTTSGSTKGDLIARTASAWAVFTGGTNGNCLLKDLTQASGVRWGSCLTGTGGGDVGGPVSSQDGGLVLFDGVTGKILKEATGSGMVKVTSGVFGVASAGTDYEQVLTFQTPLSKAAGTVTCPTCIVNTGSYNNPTWITGLAGSKISGAVPTATALESNPTDCSAGRYTTGIDSGGNLTCGQVAYSDVSGTPTLYYQTLQIGGADQGQRAKLNLVQGTNVTFSISQGADATSVTINSTASGGGSGYQFVQEEGVNVAQQLTMNFIGTAITAANDAVNGRTNVTLSQSPSGSTSLVGTGRTISTTTPITGGGALTSDLNIACSTCIVSTGSYADPSWITSVGAGKVSGSVANATLAATATVANALASNPTPCSAGQYVSDIAADGTLTCAQVAYSQVSGTPTIYNQTVQKAGVDQIQRAKVNFIEGANVTITMADSGGSTDVTIASTGPGSGGYTTIQEEGVSLTQRATLNIIGNAITATDDSGGGRTNITLSQSPAASTSVVGTGRQVGTSSPLTGGGGLSGDLTLACPTCVVTTGSYSDPSWITGLAGSKISGSVASATTATALASNPSDCAASRYATTIDAGGNLTCGQVAYSDLSGVPSTENPLTFSSPLSRSVNTISCPTCVVTSGSYADPSWVTSLAWSKISGEPTFVETSRSISAGTGLSGGGDLSQDRTLSVTANSTTQKVELAVDGILKGTRKQINLIQSGAVTAVGADNAGSDRVDVTLGLNITPLADPGSNGIVYRNASGTTQVVNVSTGLSLVGNTLSSTAVSTAFGLTEFSLTKTSDTVSTLGGSCSSSSPCTYRVGGKVYDLTSPAVGTLSGTPATGTIFWYISPTDGRVKAAHNTAATLSCDTDCDVVTGVATFPAGTIPLQAHTFTSNVLDAVAASMDHRAFISTFSLLPGTGISLSTSGSTGEVTASVDSTIQTVATDQAGSSRSCGTAGTSTAYTCSLSPAITAYTDRMTMSVTFDEVSGTNPTLNVNSLGAKNIYKSNGTSAPAQIGANELQATTYLLRYDASLNSSNGGFITDIGGGGSGGAVSNGTYANLPTCTAGSNQIYRSPFYTSYCTSGTWTHWSDPTAASATIPPTADWTNVNTDATYIEFNDMVQGPLNIILKDGGASGLQRARLRTLASGDRTIIAQFLAAGGYGQRCGLIVTDGTGSTADFKSIAATPYEGALRDVSGTDLNADGTENAAFLYWAVQDKYWLKIEHLPAGWSKTYYSSDGVTWNQVSYYAYLSFAATHVGWFARKTSTYRNGSCTLLSWSVQ